MTRPSGSTAGPAFDDALDLLRRRPALRPGIRVPYDYAPPGASTPAAPAALAAPASRGTGAAGVGPLHEAAAALADGIVTSRELVDDALEAASAHADLVGVAELDAAGARAAADAADAARTAHGRPLGLLHGIPVTVKDVIDVAGLPTRCGSLAYHDVPTTDAVAVARLRAAGAIVIAKATTHEFALGVTSPQSRNPRDPDRIPGGSSGGSAICVATGVGLASLGTDTRASIRVPAALSGVVGFKPTYGRVPTDGVVALSWTMDHVAPMATTVADAAAVLDGLLGAGSSLAALGHTTSRRLGVPMAGFADAEPGVADAVRRVLDALADAGLPVDEVKRPTADDLALANAAGLIVSRCEAAAFHHSLGLDRDLYWDEVAEQLERARSVPAVEYLDAQRVRAELAADLLRAFDDVDVLALPTVPVVAPLRTDFPAHLMLLARNAIPWSFVGFPAVSVPCGAADGLPVGLQLVAQPGREDLLVEVGRTVEVVA
jgi:aspartyl-tRNA(Asn)/glutamyl-tRNA(Gln) amidotransferase subunit A